MLALRQAGSTLKPFLYELAIERRLLTAASLMDDSPLDVSTASGLYVPQNYDRQFRGIATRVPAWLRLAQHSGRADLAADRARPLLRPPARARLRQS
ncbi:hypothetical protein LP419_06650 [Massilia sp. H-1]|nr:hypothetical protein LP419_06650 [Massilia sp. H-1]